MSRWGFMFFASVAFANTEGNHPAKKKQQKNNLSRICAPDVKQRGGGEEAKLWKCQGNMIQAASGGRKHWRGGAPNSSQTSPGLEWRRCVSVWPRASVQTGMFRRMFHGLSEGALVGLTAANSWSWVCGSNAETYFFIVLCLTRPPGGFFGLVLLQFPFTSLFPSFERFNFLSPALQVIFLKFHRDLLFIIIIIQGMQCGDGVFLFFLMLGSSQL